MKYSIKIDGVLLPTGGRKVQLQAASEVRKQTAECIAGMVAETFEQILFNAPQFTGNFVANMAVRSGLGAGSKGGEDYFPHVRSPQEVFERGNIPAIEIAKSNNPNIVKNLTAHITKQSGWMSGVTIYNRLEDAEVVEALPVTHLRDPNVPGVHPMARGRAWLEAIAGQKVVYGSPEFHSYRMK